METAVIMTIVLSILGVILYLQTFTLTLKATKNEGTWLPSTDNLAKRQFEIYALIYTCIWIAVFAVVIVTQVYENFTENGYMGLCVSLALPFLLQPILYPLEAEKNIPITQRYSFKANVWIAIFSFIGNYWYTHYFYSVLKAKYTFPAHRTNGVPIALFFATHFYFVTYHTFSNLFLRKIETKYTPNFFRSVFFWSTVLVFAYFTAFMETLTISSFPYYSFPPEIKQAIYVKGSAFYGLYFIVSFPTFYKLDEKLIEEKGPHSLTRTVLEAFGASMIVLCLLDFCRLYLDMPLTIQGSLFEVTNSAIRR